MMFPQTKTWSVCVCLVLSGSKARRRLPFLSCFFVYVFYRSIGSVQTLSRQHKLDSGQVDTQFLLHLFDGDRLLRSIDAPHLPSNRESKRELQPTWWLSPNECQVEAMECSREGKGFGSGLEAKLGDHICALDKCMPGSTESTWSILRHYWQNALDIIERIPRNTVILAIGDSTMWQQVRALNCLIEEAIGNSGHILSSYPDSSFGGHKIGAMWTSFLKKALSSNTRQHDVYLHMRKSLDTLEVWSLISFQFVALLDGETKFRGDLGELIMAHSQARGDHPLNLVVILGQGAWQNCNGQDCGEWHSNLRYLQSWWRESKGRNLLPNSYLLIRDALPQHFRNSDGRYAEGKTGSCLPFTNRRISGNQAVKVRHPDGECGRAIVQDDPRNGIRRLPLWGLAARQGHLHNGRVGDCTHYCFAAMTVWNILTVHSVVSLISGDHVANASGGVFGRILEQMSMNETRLDLLAVCG